MEYKNTINLPETNFTMKGNLSNTENKILEKNEFIYKINKNYKKIFIMNDGPPYANGQIHMGHALNKILKDFICKFKTLSGYNIDFTPGWDCHGLPIELNVEKKIEKKDFNFRIECEKYANEQILIQKKDFIRLGVTADWDNHYKTMSPNFEVSVIKSLIKIIKKKYIYIGYKPNYWCFDCKSALAESELEYKEKESHSIYLYIKCFNYNNILNKFNFKNIGFIIWTTTPWTLPSNEAIALNKNFKYIIFEYNKNAYIVSEFLYKEIKEKLNLKKTVIIKNVNATFFKDVKIKHPIYNKTSKIIFSNHVKNDTGTGCVHIAPSYGDDDYKLGIKFKLNIINTINEKGYFNNDILYFEKMYYEDVNLKVIEILKNNKNLILNEKIKHKYAHCWRHKKPLIFRTTNQWFLNVTKKTFKNKLFYLIKKYIYWLPKNGLNKMKKMFEDRLDWCISRQRMWGIPMFFFINKKNKLHKNTIKILKKSIKLTKKYGSNFWYSFDIFKKFKVNKKKYKQIFDVLDVWFDSSCVYRHILDKKKYSLLPHDMCVEGNDQYRGWFQVSLINSIICFNEIPYKKILSHGFVLDEKNRKMSKSLNNVILPNDIIKNYGADILRLWVASVNYTIDINISNEIINRICDTYRKIRNTIRFLLSNLKENKIKKNIKNDLLLIDLWIIYYTYIIKKNLINYYYKNNFHNIYKIFYNFCIDKINTKYFNLTKDRLYTDNKESNTIKSAQHTFLYILYNILKILSPILSFTSYEAWNFLLIKDEKNVLKSNLNTDFYIFAFLKNIKIIDILNINKLFKVKNIFNRIIENIRKYKKIGSTLELNLIIHCNLYIKNILIKYKKELYLFFQVSNIKIKLNQNTKRNKIFFDILNSKNKKCDRCWQRSITSEKLNICKKCILNIYYICEKRLFI